MRQIYSQILFLTLLFSCKKEQNEPTPVPPRTDTIQQNPPINKSLIVGWWKHTQSIYTVGSERYFDPKLRYFGADSFYFHDVSNILLETSTGKWWWVGNDTVYIHVTDGWGQGLYKHKVTNLVSRNMRHQLYDGFAYYSSKLDSAAIDSKPISTIAGTGEGWGQGDGGLATTVKLSYVYDVTADKAGNIFLSQGSHIRKISASDGQISIYAGIGSIGYSGDGGPALNAAIAPGHIAVDIVGNLYFTDRERHRIRKISASNQTITTIAGHPLLAESFGGDGGLAVNAQLYSPVSICVDEAGNVYFFDSGNNRIRRINADNGTIQTIVGNGSRGVVREGVHATTTPLNIASFTMDKQGNFYLSGPLEHKIFKIHAGTGIISAIAGTGTEGYNGEGISALSAHLGEPADIVADTEGNVYFSERQKGPRHYIRKISKADGKIYTVAGNGLGRYTGDGKHATAYGIGGWLNIGIDQNDNVLINEVDRVRKLLKK